MSNIKKFEEMLDRLEAHKFMEEDIIKIIYYT